MCGIAGVIAAAGTPLDETELRQACAKMRHRGPDDHGAALLSGNTSAAVDGPANGPGSATGRGPTATGSDSATDGPATSNGPASTSSGFATTGHGLAVGLGVVRLAILDPTPHGHQPFLSSDGRYALAYNGEVYNFRELRHELAGAGATFRTSTDTEVVLHACAKWGERALTRFNGMWALAFFDRQTNEGFLARDRFGIKPLVYAHHAGRVSFASELAVLEAFSLWPRDIDTDALRAYLHFGFFGGDCTIYTAARRLPPGALLRVSKSTFQNSGKPEVAQWYSTPRTTYPPTEDALASPDFAAQSASSAAQAASATSTSAPGSIAGLPGASTVSPGTRAAAPNAGSAASGSSAAASVSYASATSAGSAAPGASAMSASSAVRGSIPGAPLSYSDAMRLLPRRLAHAVAARRVADVPVGAFLSGGLDSSIIALHLAECTPGPIRTFSIGFAESAFDETPYAKQMAAHLGSRHEALTLTYRDVIDALPDVLDHLGEPFFDSSILPTAIVSRLARKHVTVCLSGDGGDELFGGYWRYLGHDAAESWRRLPAPLRAITAKLLSMAPGDRGSKLGNRVRQLRKLLRGADLTPEQRHVRWSLIVSPGDASALMGEGASTQALAETERRFASLTSSMPEADWMNRILAFDLQNALPGDMLQKVDLASMMHSLEVRVPFLDPQVVHLALAMPSAYKVSRGLRKRILADAYRGRLPDSIIDRPKMGFEVPVGAFLRKELREMWLDTVTQDCIESFGCINYAAVQRLWNEHATARADHTDILFALLSLCWWRQRR